jgi:aspartate ammonia-lyase
VGITANREVCRNYVENSIGLVTALVPVIGYEKICRHCQGGPENRRQRLPPGAGKRLADQGELDDMLRPENMTDPREIPK